jgi:hypothetical protein
MPGLFIHTQPAVKINAKLIKALDKASLYDCEGDKIWIPNSKHQYNTKEQTVLVEKWFYDIKVAEGQL